MSNKAIRLVLLVTGLIGILAIGSIIHNQLLLVAKETQVWSEAKAMDDCKARLTSALNDQQKGNIPVRVDMSKYCFSHAVRQGQLVDFSIGRTIYTEHCYETQVLL